MYAPIPKGLKKGALRSSLNEKFRNGKIIIIDEIKLAEPKTKLFSQALKALGVEKGESSIVILEKIDKNIKLASRNIPKLSVEVLKIS